MSRASNPSNPSSSSPAAVPADFRPLDPGRVRLDDDVERAWWREQLGCSDEALVAAVERVGDHATAVREALSSRPAR